MPDIAQQIAPVPEPENVIDMRTWSEKTTGDLRHDLYSLKNEDSTFRGAMEIDGSTDISTALYIDGSFDVLNTQVCLSNFAVVGDMSVDGNASIQGALAVDSSADFSDVGITGGLTIDGSVDFSDAYFAGDISVDGKLAVDNSVDFSDVAVAGDLQPTKCITDSGGYLDEDDMATDASAAAASQQSIKKYVDDQIDAIGGTNNIFGTRTDKDTDNDTLVELSVYQAECDGIVEAIEHDNNDNVISGYTDGANPPTTQLQKNATPGTRTGVSFSMHVRKGDYWKVDCLKGTPTIYWLPIGSGGCVKQ